MAQLADEAEQARIPRDARPRGDRPRPRHPRRLPAARPDHLLHRRPQGGACLDRAPRRQGAAGRGRHPHRFREGLHPRRDHLLRRFRRLRRRGRAPRKPARCASKARTTSSRTATSCISGSTSESGSSSGLRRLLSLISPPGAETDQYTQEDFHGTDDFADRQGRLQARRLSWPSPQDKPQGRHRRHPGDLRRQPPHQGGDRPLRRAWAMPRWRRRCSTASSRASSWATTPKSIEEGRALRRQDHAGGDARRHPGGDRLRQAIRQGGGGRLLLGRLASPSSPPPGLRASPRRWAITAA